MFVERESCIKCNTKQLQWIFKAAICTNNLNTTIAINTSQPLSGSENYTHFSAGWSLSCLSVTYLQWDYTTEQLVSGRYTRGVQWRIDLDGVPDPSLRS